MNNFAKNLTNIRRWQKLSQKEAAEKFGVPQSTYANWEQGRREPSIQGIYLIINTFGISANDLFEQGN